jgi:uncharacterized repeat protein (TIGR01451 family)
MCFLLSITPSAGDLNPSNNVVYLCFPVTSSYDPNAISVSPQGACEEHFVPKSAPLVYTIQFQNTGTSEAENVYILDSLSPYLDPTTISVKGHSHDLYTELLTGNVLKFVFSNIHLPDSATDEGGSHGWVTYEVMPTAGSPDGTTVYNQAGIYFDFNMPVFTNRVMNTLMDIVPPCIPDAVIHPSDENKISIFPNPASETFTVSSSIPMSEIKIVNTLGQVMMKADAGRQTSFSLGIGNLPSGIYHVTVKAGQQQWVGKLVVN